MIKKAFYALLEVISSILGLIIDLSMKVFKFAEEVHLLQAIIMSIVIIPATFYILFSLLDLIKDIYILKEMVSVIIFFYIVALIGITISLYRLITGDNNFSKEHPKPFMYEIRIIPRITLASGIFGVALIPLDIIIFLIGGAFMY